MEPDKDGPVQEPLGEAIADLDRKELCDLVVRLCELIQQEVGTGAYRGGVFPNNIRLEEDGTVVLGPAAEADWQGQECDFLAPELFWHGQKSPAADVYSLGLLLYYAVNSARLPFYKSGEKGARQRRMNGEPITPPKAAGRRLGEIIVKATAFPMAERYQSVEELRAALLSCVSNIYLTGPVSAETLYHKKEEDLSKVEKMMLDILRKEEDPEIVKNEIDEEEVPQEPIVGPLMDEEKTPETGPKPEAPAVKPEEPIVILTEEKNPELEPVVIGRSAPPQYQNRSEQERKIAGKVRRRRMRPVVIILIVCALLFAAAAIYEHLKPQEEEKRLADTATVTQNEQPGLPIADTPVPEETAVPTAAPTPAPTEEPKESRYEIIVSDVSWTEARDSAASAGGHLVVINDEAEYRKVLEMAKEKGVSYVWLGCRRVDGAMTWLDNAQVDYWPWTPGEPSFVDGEVSEDYLMLSKRGDEWGYNDNRNDPAGDYPEYYSGRVAYVIEFD